MVKKYLLDKQIGMIEIEEQEHLINLVTCSDVDEMMRHFDFQQCPICKSSELINGSFIHIEKDSKLC